MSERKVRQAISVQKREPGCLTRGIGGGMVEGRGMGLEGDSGGGQGQGLAGRWRVTGAPARAYGEPCPTYEIPLIIY